MLNRLLPNLNPKSNLRIGLIFFGIVIVTAGLLRFAQWMFPVSNPSLLPEEKTMIRLTDPNDISKYVDWLGQLPKKVFGGELQVIGIYPEGTAVFSKNTVAIVYVKNGFRFIEVDYQPDKKLETERIFYGALPSQEIALTDSTKGLLVNVLENSYCKKPGEDAIGMCQITRVLMFEKGGSLVMISVDGNHASDGELIEIARSILVDEEIL
ncbi:hypothetical protein HYV69_04270 [Candidatus Uhrbacteria bacterium]|nr:hypothetical protein [Candidatus Uhrbacteria bacterium]